MDGHQLQKIFQTLPDTGEDNDYDKCAQALDKYFEVKKNVPKERQNFLSTSPEGGETINNFIVRLKKTVEHCEYGIEEDNQIRDRLLYFIRDKVLKRKLYREEILTLAKLQEIVNIFDEPDALLLTPSGTREETNTIYTKHSIGFNSSDRTFKGKCWRYDSIGHKIGHFPPC